MSETEVKPKKGLDLRYTIMEDGEYLKKWLLDPSVVHAFAMSGETEVDDAVKHWISFARYRSSLTALMDGVPCGIATLCLMPYKKLAHQCLLSIIVSEEFRGRGVGTLLMNNLCHLAKHQFGIEVLYLEVYEKNPALSLYQRFNFKEVGYQRYFIKEVDKAYHGKLIMEKVL